MMEPPLLVAFPGADQKAPHLVGGKGASLIRMADSGLAVPSGIVLTTAFFESWFEALKSSDTWNILIQSSEEEWPPLCAELKEQAQALPLATAQQDTLDAAIASFDDDTFRFAVRSSSPEEDMASASFAGGYETRLGVHPKDLEDAVRTCFESSLDVRVFTYKNQRGFDVWSPSIAVIAQQQVASEVSGVGFSLNPVTNDYDEVVIDANWGLGTSVVDGRVSPDHFVVDKINRRVIEISTGNKQSSEWLDPDRGTIERANETPNQRTLSDDHLLELTDAIVQIEALYDMPIDVEWAYADGELHVLQARPITTYVPLPPEMTTLPGQKRHLYADAALSKGMTINAPISPLGIDNMKRLFGLILKSTAGLELKDLPPEKALIVFTGGRMYMNYSNLLWLTKPKSLAKSMASTDALMAEILANVDIDEYRSAEKPPWMNLRLLGIIPRVLWKLRGVFGNLLRALFAPEAADAAYQRTIDRIATDLHGQIEGGLSLEDYYRTFQPRMANELFGEMMPVLLVGIIAPEIALPGADDDMKALAAKLSLGANGNVVVEMGIALYRLARQLAPSDYDDLDQLAGRIEERQMPQAFLEDWDDFIERYGWRGPQEMDPASPRYADDPRLALRQMSYMAEDDGSSDPAASHRHLIEQREEAYAALMQRLGPVRRRLLQWVYRRTERFAGTRDTPKYLIVLYNYVVRRRVLEIGQHFVEEGRLDCLEDIFAFTFDDLAAAEEDQTLDLRCLRDERMRFHEKLKTHVKTFPPVIDSRGKILRPVYDDSEVVPGVLKGMPVSSGMVTGPVKVLHTADEKPVEKGDILVAYTTDPGWTPLFVNAAAIVLEVGGVLQHGAVVAREYGKPCVVGIDRITSILSDGELVEVDGSTGTVKVLS